MSIKIPFLWGKLRNLAITFKRVVFMYCKITIFPKDTTSLPSREEWELMHLKAERKAKEMLAKYEKKCIAKKVCVK